MSLPQHPLVTADRGDAGRRIDVVLRRHLRGADAVSRTRLQRWIAEGRVTLNGATILRPSRRAAYGDRLEVARPSRRPRLRVVAERAGCDLLRVLYEDEDLLVLDKPAGVVVHPTYRHPTGTLMNALLWYARRWPTGCRPALAGRLDKDTSGVLLVAKHRAALAALQRLTSRGAAQKDYLAVAYGVTPVRGTIDAPLAPDPGDRRRTTPSAAGAPSLTTFERLARTASGVGLSVLKCRLGSGRRHQIRAHLAARGWPIVGDRVYGDARWQAVTNPALAAALREFPRQALHAWRMSFGHPASGRLVEIAANVPADIVGLLAAVGLPSDIPALLMQSRAPLIRQPAFSSRP